MCADVLLVKQQQWYDNKVLLFAATDFLVLVSWYCMYYYSILCRVNIAKLRTHIYFMHCDIRPSVCRYASKDIKLMYKWFLVSFCIFSLLFFFITNEHMLHRPIIHFVRLSIPWFCRFATYGCCQPCFLNLFNYVCFSF